MHCAHCERAVAAELGRAAGVESVDVDLDTKLVVVRGESLDDSALRAATEESRLRGGVSATVQLDLEGMTCAACAARIEKNLNKVDGAEASVNFAAERATVRGGDDVPVATLIAAVRSAGYNAHAHDAGARTTTTTSR